MVARRCELNCLAICGMIHRFDGGIFVHRNEDRYESTVFYHQLTIEGYELKSLSILQRDGRVKVNIENASSIGFDL